MFRKAVLKVHLWLGLGTGLIVLIVSLTGAGWAFKDEFQSAGEGYVFDVATDDKLITPTEARLAALEVYPDKAVHGTKYSSRDDVIEVIFYQSRPTEFYHSVFLHPTTGQVLETVDHMSGFFAFMLRGHRFLWMSKDIGGPIVKYSILLFLIIIISGLILWWPKSRKAAKQRLIYDWKSSTRWRRKNFDLHAVTGFYLYSFAFIFAFTGSVMSFPWFYYMVFKGAGGDSNPRFVIPDNVTSASMEMESDVYPLDLLIPQLQAANPDVSSFELHYPHSDSASIYVEMVSTEGVYYSSDYRFFDQYSLEEIETPSIYGKYENADFADKVMRMNYDIHIGAIAGLTGKIIAFITSLLMGSLPVTGFMIWWGRRKKTPVKHQNRARSLTTA